jgi:hypothetical protein
MEWSLKNIAIQSKHTHIPVHTDPKTCKILQILLQAISPEPIAVQCKQIQFHNVQGILSVIVEAQHCTNISGRTYMRQLYRA